MPNSTDRRKKKIAPIPLIGISALLGILVCGIL